MNLTIDGMPVSVSAGTTIYDAAKRAGIGIPVLCHHAKLDPVGVCRMCVVDVGGRVLAASCVRPCEEGMKVETNSPKVEKQR
jgi:formate dehydrogenase major subunit